MITISSSPKLLKMTISKINQNNTLTMMAMMLTTTMNTVQKPNRLMLHNVMLRWKREKNQLNSSPKMHLSRKYRPLLKLDLPNPMKRKTKTKRSRTKTISIWKMLKKRVRKKAKMINMI